MTTRRRVVLLAVIAVAIAGTVSGVLVTMSGGNDRLSRSEAERAVAEVRSSGVGPAPELLPLRVGVYQDHFFASVPGGTTWVRIRSDARRVSSGVEVTMLMKEPDFTGNHRWWRWKVLPSQKVIYEGEGGTRCWPGSDDCR